MIRSISSNAFSRWLCAPLFIAGFNHSPAKRHFPGILFGLKKPTESMLFKKYIQKLGETKQTKARLQLLYGVSSFTLTKELADNFTSDHILIWAEENAFMNWERQGLVQKELLRTKNSFKIPHSGHLCMYEEPEQVNRIIADYLITRKW
jgi:pimeloyl-ACP methyl ester carboxylesterase